MALILSLGFQYHLPPQCLTWHRCHNIAASLNIVYKYVRYWLSLCGDRDGRSPIIWHRNDQIKVGCMAAVAGDVSWDADLGSYPIMRNQDNYAHIPVTRLVSDWKHVVSYVKLGFPVRFVRNGLPFTRSFTVNLPNDMKDDWVHFCRSFRQVR